MAVRPLLLKNISLLSFRQSAPVSFAAWLGVYSYGFPFVTVRRLVTRIALNTLKEFASIGHEDEEGLSKPVHRGASRERKAGG